MTQIQIQLEQLRDLDVREFIHRNVPVLPQQPETLGTKVKQVAALDVDVVGDCTDFVGAIDAASICEDQMFVRQHVWLIDAMLVVGQWVFVGAGGLLFLASLQ